MYLRVLVLGIMLFTSPSLAQDMPAPMGFRTMDLLMQCQRPPEIKDVSEFKLNVVTCASYLNGIMDANIMMSMIEGHAPVFCLPPGGIPGTQAIRIFVNWAREHPEELHEHRRFGATRSLLTAFPCR